jgi:2-polyprenyl-6-hydroxyphenyl methylase/3-demethylubiquinone-9 3-methyltransferase
MSTGSTSATPDYGWVSGVAEESHDYLQTPILRLVDELAVRSKARNHTLRVFDAGCGNGALLLSLMTRGYVLAGCDASQSGVREARKQCGQLAQVEHLSVYDDLAAVFDRKWDVVIATEVIEHLYSPRVFIERAKEMLRPGGTLILTTPYHGYIKNLVMAVSGKLDAHFTALWDGGHIKFWSHRTMTRLLLEFGMTDISFSGAGRFPGLWKSMVVTCRKSL